MGRSDVEESNVIHFIFSLPAPSFRKQGLRPKLDLVVTTYPLPAITTSQGGLGSMSLSATVREWLRSKLQRHKWGHSFFELCGKATKTFSSDTQISTLFECHPILNLHWRSSTVSQFPWLQTKQCTSFGPIVTYITCCMTVSSHIVCM